MKPWVCIVKREVRTGGESFRCRHSEGCGQMEYDGEAIVVAKEQGEWPEWAIDFLERHLVSRAEAPETLDALAVAANADNGD